MYAFALCLCHARSLPSFVQMDVWTFLTPLVHNLLDRIFLRNLPLCLSLEEITSHVWLYANVYAPLGVGALPPTYFIALIIQQHEAVANPHVSASLSAKEFVCSTTPFHPPSPSTYQRAVRIVANGSRPRYTGVVGFVQIPCAYSQVKVVNMWFNFGYMFHLYIRNETMGVLEKNMYLF